MLPENTWKGRSIDMDKNFVIDNAVGIEIEGRMYDLHNFYDFKELKVDAAANAVSLIFIVNAEFEKEQGDDGKEVSIKFRDVDYFELSSNFASKLTHGLEEIGYKNPGDRDVDWLIGENKSTGGDHLLFRFANDEFLRIHAKKAYCSVC